jgi:hypothetical protein
MAEIKTQILLRSDTAAKWQAANPKLGKGEVGIELDTNKIKIGDNATAWNDLPYFGGTENVYQENITTPGQAVGDIAVVKTEIANDKFSYTSYVWNGEAWAAMDGNYKSENVYFDQDLLTTAAIGNIKLTGGQATISAAGKNLNEVWEQIFVAEKTNFTVTQPGFSFSSGIPGSDDSRIVYLEIGSSGSASLSGSYSDGKYEFGYTTESQTGADGSESASAVVVGEATGANITAYAYKDSDNEVKYDDTTTNHTSSSISFSINSGVKTSKGSKKVSVKVDWDEGYIPVSNLKKKYASKKIAASNKEVTTSKDVFRWYVPMYHGFTYADSGTVADPANVSNMIITSLTKITNKPAYDETKPTSATATKPWRQYFVAIPKSYSASKPQILDGNNITCTVQKAANVTIPFGENNAVSVEYDVYYVDNFADYKTLGLQISWGGNN